MTAQSSSARKAEHVTPPVNGDFYQIADLLSPNERIVAQRVRDFMQAEVAPIIEDYWARDKFPFEIIPKIAGVGIGGIGYEGYGSGTPRNSGRLGRRGRAAPARSSVHPEDDAEARLAAHHGIADDHRLHFAHRPSAMAPVAKRSEIRAGASHPGFSCLGFII